MIKPDVGNVAYGPHERNRMDLYRAPKAAAARAFFFMHGGGFSSGDKAPVPPTLLTCLLQGGISVVSTNYRFSHQAIYPAPFHDCRRAFQFARHHASKWGLDPARMAVGGISAGGAMALWLAFRPDMAEPESDDPVARESTRPSCACVFDCQTSYDPRFIAEVVGGRAHLDGALPLLFGVPKESWPALDEAAARLVEDAAPVNFLAADAPPVLCIYSRSAQPVTDEDPPVLGIHHPAFGLDLQERMTAFSCECTVLADQSGDQDEAILRRINEKVLAFLKKHI